MDRTTELRARTGVWFVGARGSVATTAVVGAYAVSHGLAPTTGLVTELPELLPDGLTPPSNAAAPVTQLEPGIGERVKLWIEVGLPDADRLLKAARHSERVILFTYGKASLAYSLWWFTDSGGDTSESRTPACPNAGSPDAGCDGNFGRGGSLGYQATIGLALRAERLDPLEIGLRRPRRGQGSAAESGGKLAQSAVAQRILWQHGTVHSWSEEEDRKRPQAWQANTSCATGFGGPQP